MRVSQSRRRGFTLVELLVAVGIILVLAGLALLVANSGLIGNVRTSSGSDRIAGWLMQARAKAQRDGAPRGIRFIPDANGFIREAQLIEVPEPFTLPAGNTLLIEQSSNGAGGFNKRIYVIGPNISELSNVNAGDTLSIPSLGTIHRVLVTPNTTVTINLPTSPMPTPVSAVEIQVADANKIPDLGASASTTAGTPTFSTTTFGFIRQARPTFGETPLLIPDSVAVIVNPANPNNAQNTTAGQLSLSLLQPPPVALPAPFFDVVFSPSGEVQNTGALGRLVLWTANPEALGSLPSADGPRSGGDVRATYEQSGEMRLIVVYSKTGAVAVQPVPLPSGGAFDPYSTTKDGIGSGL